MKSKNIIESEEGIRKIVEAITTVAVVGMKDESQEDTAAYQIPRMLIEHGLKVIPVNPKIETSLGLKAYPSLAAYGKAVDLVDVFRAPPAVGPLAEEVLALPVSNRPKVFWMQSGIRHEEAAIKLADAGIRVVMDACLGVYVSRYR